MWTSALALGRRLPLYDNPNTSSVCFPASNHPQVSENLSKQKNQIVMTFAFLVTFKSNFSLQNVQLITENQYIYPYKFLFLNCVLVRHRVSDRNDLDLWTVTKYSTSKN